MAGLQLAWDSLYPWLFKRIGVSLVDDAEKKPNLSVALALALIAMRDSLARTSLILHDLQYDLLKRHGCSPGARVAETDRDRDSR
jgi:hypothetical protein